MAITAFIDFTDIQAQYCAVDRYVFLNHDFPEIHILLLCGADLRCLLIAVQKTH